MRRRVCVCLGEALVAPVAAAVCEAFALPAKGLERLYVFRNRVGRVVAMKQEDVHMVGAESLQRLVDFPADALDRDDLLLRLTDDVAALRQEEDFVAVPRRGLEPFRNRLLGASVAASRVDGVEARVHGGGEEIVRVAATKHNRNGGS